MRKKQRTANKVGKALIVPLLSAAILAPALMTAPKISLADDSGEKPLNTLFSSDYENESSLLKAQAALNLQMATEGSVLLKNKNNALPLMSNEKNVTVFNTMYSNWDDDPQYGYGIGDIFVAGMGSGTIAKKGGASQQDIYKGLSNNGFNVNPVMKGVADEFMHPMSHDQGVLVKSDGPQVDFIKEKAGSSFSSYSDAAIITISRLEGEASDINNVMTDAATLLFKSGQEGVDHYLQLNTGEKELISYAKQTFKKVIILLNTGSPMEISGLEDDDDVDAIMWIGYPGYNGLTAIGDLLSGKSQPSGKTVDIWTNDMSKDPTWQNFGDNTQTEGFEGDGNIWITDKNGNKVASSNDKYFSSVDYEEGIYLGYRFYETAADIGYFDATKPANANDMPAGVTDRYYNRTNGVTYPFGYGLSYTTFSQKIVASSVNTSGETISFDVQVTNTGNVNGKEVVQVYYNPPYTEGGIEKATANLVAFAKTSDLRPGASETVTVTFNKRDMASYDYNDANVDGHYGYELEKGKYEISINSDSHNVLDKIDYTASATTYYDTDSATGTEITNKFSTENGWYNVDKSNYTLDGNGVTFMSRASVGGQNGFVATFPQAPTAADLKFSDAAIAFLKTQNNFDVSYDEEDSPWVTDAVIPADWTQASAAEVAARKISEWSKKPIADIELMDMIGIDYLDTDTPVTINDTEYESGEAAWTAFMNQLSYEEMVDFVSSGLYETAEVSGVGKPATVDGDGPAQFKQYSTATKVYGYGFVCGVVLASTWNAELAEEFGKSIGEWGLYSGATGWYGPSVNIHRSPLGGRNFEYLSEDGLLAGKIAAGMVKGAASKGLITYIKHFALNSQEAERHGVCEWTNEQALREIYFKPFELAIKEGGTTGMMCAFNRVGGVPAATNYNLMVNLLEKEWGFKGAHVTDYYGDIRWPGNALVRCHLFPMGNYEGSEKIHGTWDETSECVKVDGVQSDALWYAVRTTSMHMMYACANSSLMGIYDKFNLNQDGIVDKHYTFYQGQTGGYIQIAYYNDFEDSDVYADRLGIEGPGISCSKQHGDEWHNLIPGVAFHCGRGDSFTGCSSQNAGMFTTAGHWEFDLIAYKGGSENGRAKLIFDVISAFEIDQKSETAISGSEYSAQVDIAPGAFVGSIDNCTDPNGTLPAGLSVDKTGKITGRTSDLGSHQVKLLINNTYWFEYNLVVEDNPFTISSGSDSAVQGIAYEAQIGLEDGSFIDEIYSCAGSLPAGLSVDYTGKITGIPKESGTFTVTILVNNSYTFEYELTIESMFSTAAGNYSLVAGREYDAQFSPDAAAPFTKIDTCVDVNGTLPEGLTVDNSGRITGRTDAIGKHEIELLVNSEYTLSFTLEVVDGIAFRIHDGYLQVRCSVDDDWTNLYAMADLKGEQGDKGETGDTPTISISDDGYWVINGQKSDVKATGDAAANEEKGGCNGSMSVAGVAVTSSVILLAGAIVHIARKKKQN